MRLGCVWQLSFLCWFRSVQLLPWQFYCCCLLIKHIMVLSMCTATSKLSLLVSGAQLLWVLSSVCSLWSSCVYLVLLLVVVGTCFQHCILTKGTVDVYIPCEWVSGYPFVFGWIQLCFLVVYVRNVLHGYGCTSHRVSLPILMLIVIQNWVLQVLKKTKLLTRLSLSCPGSFSLGHGCGC